MDSHFEFQDIDKVSSIPTTHLSYIVQQLLPVRLIGHQRFEMFDKRFQQRTDLDDDDFQVLPVGSLAEGLNMPPVIIKKSGEEIYGGDFTDMDLMLVQVKEQVTFEQSKMYTEEYYALAETDDIHIGYARINFSKNPKVPMYKDGKILQMHMLSEALKITTNEKKIEINGPAITTLTPPVTKSNYKTHDKAPSTDQVLALPCKEWPPMARNWIARSHDRGWLDSTLIHSLTADGCHFVPACHRLSTTPHEEWRISFAATERRIAREAVTDHQRQAYILIKLLYHQTLKEKGLVTSYHLKTVFFHACERIPQMAWDENIGACIFYFLDILIDCIKKKTIPNFFIPENNLIDYLTDEEIQILKTTLEKLRRDLILPLLDFTDEKLISLASVQHPFRSLIEPVLSDMNMYLKHKDQKCTVLNAFIPTSFNILLKQLEEGKPEESVHVATELHSLLVKHNMTEETLPEFFTWNIAHHMTDGRLSISFLEQAISMHEGDEDFNCCRDHLPCMYHVAAYRFPPKSHEHKVYCDKAEQAFLSQFAHQGVSGAYCDYSLLLIKQNRFNEALTWLNKVIEEDNANLGNIYDADEIMTVDEVIQNEIVEHNNFSAPSTSLAYYLKVFCLKRCSEGQNNTMDSLLQNFKHHADVEKLPRTYALLGYSYMDCGDWRAASDALSLAIKADTQGEYTRACKMKRYCDERISQQEKSQI
ncbi:uncharacterized protein LOC123525291 [Mercenaria mercenaria]|uniref:uncharacterized protein LOC123525291 n=1 Tax=Mercenaria mercenaria TaxID=6596 RepID=UPI00234F5EA1|nr:uncharacterized protein LOC123525291 [Mercenaria mercenaria]